MEVITMSKKTITRNISLGEELYKQIKQAAEKEEMTVSEFLRYLAKDFIKKQNKEAKND